MQHEPAKADHQIWLSTTWIFVLINMIYADIIGMLRPGYLELLEITSHELSSGMVLTFSTLMEVPILIILLSRMLNRRLNRIAHCIAVPITIVYVIYGGMDNPPVSYLFFAGVEILAMVFILWTVLNWRSLSSLTSEKR